VASEVIADRYRLERRLGGGMSEVWEATDLDLDRMVAIKVLAPHADPTRFEREARAVAALAHPNVCTLYSYGERGGRAFMVLEYLPGGSLEDRLAGNAHLPDQDVGRIASEIAAGLAHAHARGVVHRDLKPSNILFDAQGRAKIADFGIALLGQQSGLTQAGTVFGTAAYLSPEQAAGEPATPASDVYAFGVILFRMLTGQLPFASDDALTVAAMHREQAAPLVTSIRPDAPARLESLAAAALAKSPRDRPQDGAALLAELGDTGSRASEETAVTQILRPHRRRRLVATLAVSALVAAAGGALAIVLTRHAGSPSKPASSSTPSVSSAERSQPAPVTPTTPESSTSEPVTTQPATTTLPAAPTTQPTTSSPATSSSPTPPPATTAALPPPTPPETIAPATTLETVPTDTAVTDTVPTTAATTTEPAPTVVPG
jgi:serine/threonine protein kinase